MSGDGKKPGRTKSSLRKESLRRSTRCHAPKVDLPKQNLMVSIWIANPHQPHALRVALSREELARLIDLKLLPGMPVEAGHDMLTERMRHMIDDVLPGGFLPTICGTDS